MPDKGKKIHQQKEKLPDEAQVKAYLEAYPEFLAKHPDLLESLLPPAQQTGENIADFHHYAMRHLQDQIRDVRQERDHLVNSVRGNVSVQQQVHHAIVQLIRAHGLEQLLEAVTVDLAQLFDVDVVRLALETDMVQMVEHYYPEEHYSGVVFVETGLADCLFADNDDVLLIEDTQNYTIPGFEALFTECTRLARSCAMLRLSLPEEEREVILAFGVRHAGRFHPGQGAELLGFLGVILQERLSECLKQEDPGPMI